jgi:endonuclease V-like protein UPF0215 family
VSRKEDSSLTDIICQILKKSKHYGQVRIILLDEKTLPEPVNTKTIWKSTGKPVLVRTLDRGYDPRHMIRYNGHIFFSTGIDEESVRRVLKKIYRNSVSEALRISNIIIRNVTTLHNV